MKQYKVLSYSTPKLFQQALNQYVQEGWYIEPYTFQVTEGGTNTTYTIILYTA